MAKKTLAEAAKDILTANVLSKREQGEKFGAGKHPQSYAPQPASKEEDLGGDHAEDNTKETGVNFGTDGIDAASGAGPKGPDYPGATPPVKSAPMKNIHNNVDDEGKKRVSVNDSGIAEEEEEEEGKKRLREEEEEDKDDDKKSEKKDDDKDDDKKDGDKDDDCDDDGDKKHVKEEGHSEFEKDTTHTLATLDSAGKDTMGIPAAEPVDSKVKAYVKGKGAGGLEEDVQAIFHGEKLSKEFMKKARMIYEAAVIKTSTAVCESIEEQYVDLLETAVDTLKEEMTTKVDDYLNYMVEEWVKENEIAIEKGLRSELVEDFIGGLRNLFLEHYIDIPEDKVNIVEELSSKVEELEGKLNEEITRNVDLKKALTESKRSEVIDAVCEGLTDTQVAKLKKLAEGVEFTSEKEFAENVKVLRENYFPTKAAVEQKLDDESVEGDEKGVLTENTNKTGNPLMDAYVSVIGKTAVK